MTSTNVNTGLSPGAGDLLTWPPTAATVFLLVWEAPTAPGLLGRRLRRQGSKISFFGILTKLDETERGWRGLSDAAKIIEKDSNGEGW